MRLWDQSKASGVVRPARPHPPGTDSTVALTWYGLPRTRNSRPIPPAPRPGPTVPRALSSGIFLSLTETLAGHSLADAPPGLFLITATTLLGLLPVAVDERWRLTRRSGVPYRTVRDVFQC